MMLLTALGGPQVVINIFQRSVDWAFANLLGIMGHEGTLTGAGTSTFRIF